MVETVPESKHLASNYLRKAAENDEFMKKALQEGVWNTACLLAVHCVISSADALSVHHFGRRCKSQRPQDAVQLIQQIPLPESQENGRRFLKVLDLKNKVEYQNDLVPEKQARQISEQAERFYQWVKSQMPK